MRELSSPPPPGETLKRSIAAILAYVEWFGPAHVDESDCPADDTCSCAGAPINDGMNAAIRHLQALASALPPTPEEADASIERSWEILNHGYELGKRVASEAALPPPPTETPDQVEALAEYAHRAWSGWMRHLFANWDTVHLQQWKRQMSTPYVELPEPEKESDRKEAREMLRVIGVAARPPAREPRMVDVDAFAEAIAFRVAEFPPLARLVTIDKERLRIELEKLVAEVPPREGEQTDAVVANELFEIAECFAESQEYHWERRFRALANRLLGEGAAPAAPPGEQS